MTDAEPPGTHAATAPASSASDMDATPYVSVIVPVHDDPVGLRRCVAALSAQTWPRENFEIIVGDDGSSVAIDHDVQESATVIRCRHGGSYAARNAGINAARGQVLAFTDADCIPDAEWLERGVRALERTGFEAAVAGAIRIPDGGAAASVAARYECTFAFPQRVYVERDHFGATANLIVPAAVMTRVGAFDERLSSGGDWEWGQRARRAGVSIVYAPDAQVVHPPRSTVRALLRKNARVARGNATLARQGYYRSRQIVSLWGSALLPPVCDAARVLLDARSGPLRSRPAVAGLRMLLWAHRLAILVRGRAWP